MVFDEGFAPNPFYGILTLATCKPKIRATKGIGTFLAGFTSNKLSGDLVGHERLVYIMRITEILTFDEYFKDSRFKCKKPSPNNIISTRGDNIYFISDGKYQQSFSYFHKPKEEISNDLKSDKVLISDDFFYFGSGAVPLDKFKINIPKTQTSFGVKTSNEKEVCNLYKYLNKNYKKNSVINPPHGMVKYSLSNYDMINTNTLLKCSD